MDEEKPKPKPEYETPTIKTYTEEQILDELGPAQAMQSALGENPWSP